MQHSLSQLLIDNLLECPEFDVPPLIYNDDENPDDSLWVKVAKVVLTEQGVNTLKYIKSYKSMYEKYLDSGHMPFHYVTNKAPVQKQTTDNLSLTKTSSKVSKFFKNVCLYLSIEKDRKGKKTK